MYLTESIAFTMVHYVYGVDTYVLPVTRYPTITSFHLILGRVFRHPFTSSRSRGDVVTNITAGRINYYTSQRLTAVDLLGAVVKP